MLKGVIMDISTIKDKVNVMLPYLTYLSDLFTKILELFGSFFGIDITGRTPPVSEDDNTAVTD